MRNEYKKASICIIACLVLLVANHASSIFNGMIYHLIPYISSIGLLLSGFAFFEPDVYQFTSQNMKMPMEMKLKYIGLVVVGLACGFCINKFVYHSTPFGI